MRRIKIVDSLELKASLVNINNQIKKIWIKNNFLILITIFSNLKVKIIKFKMAKYRQFNNNNLIRNYKNIL